VERVAVKPVVAKGVAQRPEGCGEETINDLECTALTYKDGRFLQSFISKRCNKK
jgi:hypothetical protein